MDSSLSQIRKIDNSRLFLPFATTILIIILIVIFVWFFRGGSFRLYASAFFGLYAITGQIWVSVLLIGIMQNIVFLPLRYIGLKLSTRLDEFEETLEKIKSENEQYLIFSEKVKKGDVAILFFIFSFIVNAIAFLSAGRIFLIDFYTQPLNSAYLYSFIPYPHYPLQGTNFFFPFVNITRTIAFSWHQIFIFWLVVILALSLPRLLWRFVKIFLKKNKKVLSYRIKYNRAAIGLGGIIGSIFLISLFLFRHFPVAFKGLFLVADLTRQNTPMNFITAVGTFITTIHAGYTRQRIASKKAETAGISTDVIARVARENLRRSFQNAIFLGLGAFFITNHIPCAFELSVATFEVLYMLSPYTFDRFLTHVSKPSKPAPPVYIPVASV